MNAELIKALRCNDEHPKCESCKYGKVVFRTSRVGDVYGCDSRRIENDAADALEAAEKRIAELERQLLKEGEWEKAKPKGIVSYSDGYAECSNCHDTIWLGWKMHYCPNCGARMDGENDE